MSAREPNHRHSDLGPSSKDWAPGSHGRDEDFTPEKDLWTLSHKGNLGEGRPGEDLQRSGDQASGQGTGGDVQPGTAHEGRSWQSRRPDPDSQDDKLDQALKDSFPASDPPEAAQPGVTGWDLPKEARQGDRRLRERPSRFGRSPQSFRTTSPGWLWLAAGVALLSVLLSSSAARQPKRRSRPRRA